MTPSRAKVAALLFCCAAPFFASLHTPGLLNPDEGRYAEVAREMIVTGDYVVPRLHGTPRWSKPPGTYWCAAASMRVFGYRPFAARLPSAVFGWIAVVALYALVRDMSDVRTGLFASAIFSSSAQAFLLFRTADPNAATAACVVVAVYAFRRAGARGGDGSGGVATLPALAGCAALGVGFMFKGPIPAMLVGAAFGAAALVRRFAKSAPVEKRSGDVLKTALVAIAGVVVFCAIALPWYAAAIERRPGLLEHWIGMEVVDRYFGDDHRRTQPWWFFPVLLPFVAAPWTFVWLRGAFAAARGKEEGPRFLLVWAASTVGLFSIGTSKLWTYLLPAIAPFAGLAASALRRDATAASATTARRLRIATYAFVALIPPIGAALLQRRLGAPLVAFLAVSAVSVAAAFVAERVSNRRSKRGDETGAATAIVAGAACASWIALTGSIFVVGSRFEHLGDKGDSRWVREALEGEGAAVRGTPLWTGLSGADRPEPTFPTGDRLATFRMYQPGLPFDVAPDRAEVFPGYEVASLFEIADDRAKDRVPTGADLRALVEKSGRTYVLTRAKDRVALEEAVGRPAFVVRGVSEGKYALILARFDSGPPPK